jgi:hypothetical protein
MKTLRIAVLAAAVAVPSLAFAQDQQTNQPGGTVTGVLGGAAVGAVVGGPVGAVVGAGVGAIVGSSLPAQPSVVYSGRWLSANRCRRRSPSTRSRDIANTSTRSSTISA